MLTRGLLVVIVVLAGCTRHNKFFCNDPDNAGDPECSMIDAGSDGSGSGSSCTDSSMCTMPGAMVCDTAISMCVECTMDAECSDPTKPICDHDACRGCSADSECTASLFCDLDVGTCAAPGDVLYVTMGGLGDCSQGSPCGKLS